MALTTPPTAPSTSDPTTFAARADALVAWYATNVAELGALQTDVNAKQGTASTAATTATTQAGLAADQAALANADAIATAADRVQTGLDRTAAANSAASAAAIAGAFVGTSTSSLLIAIGSKAFTTQTGEQYTAGIWMTAVSAANAANWMFGQVTSYAGTALVLDVQAIGGSGTFADWNLSLTGARGAVGPAGTLSGNAAGAISMVDQQFSRAMLIDCGYVYLDKGNSGTALQTFDYTAGSVQKVTATGSHTFAFSNWPPTGNEGYLRVDFANYGAFTITPPVVTWTNPDGTETTTLSAHFTALAAAGGRAGFTASGLTKAIFWCKDAGGVVYGKFI